MFDDATASQKGRFAQATFNAGLAFQRCNDDKNARAKFEQVLKDDPKFHAARAEVALYQYKQDSNEDAAIGAMQQAVTDAQFQNVPALVNLAMTSTWSKSRAAPGATRRVSGACGWHLNSPTTRRLPA